MCPFFRGKSSPQLPRGWDVERVKPNISENAEKRGRSEDSGQTLSREEKKETDEKELGKGMPSPHQVGMCDQMH